ncbi:putative quinol monooxygenase [Xanthomonas hortorum]|uniref:putative quinol monooxygenase n=1 Tax=Xanthomonas hortorum TaxID=56454 RepID=UPI001592B30D|nr:putative quinol monooxygenase [Xanthomonas hortorum]NHF65954.1 antibiotic biosynthesis monooxygenase [Xanthomonas hortorum]
MIGMMVKLTVKPASGAAFESAFAAQAAAVRTNEQGNRLYKLFRSRVRPDSYVLMEIYENDAALNAHRDAPHMAAHRPLTAAFIAAEPDIEAFDVIAHAV